MRSLQISSGINLVKQKSKAPEIGDLFAKIESLDSTVLLHCVQINRLFDILNERNDHAI